MSDQLETLTPQPTDLMYPTAEPDTIDRNNMVLQLAQAFRLIDATYEILNNEGGIDPSHATAVVSALAQQMEELAAVISIQNSVTVGEYQTGCAQLEDFYKEEMAKVLAQLAEHHDHEHHDHDHA